MVSFQSVFDVTTGRGQDAEELGVMPTLPGSTSLGALVPTVRPWTPSLTSPRLSYVRCKPEVLTVPADENNYED